MKMSFQNQIQRHVNKSMALNYVALHPNKHGACFLHLEDRSWGLCDLEEVENESFVFWIIHTMMTEQCQFSMKWLDRALKYSDLQIMKKWNDYLDFDVFKCVKLVPKAWKRRNNQHLYFQKLCSAGNSLFCQFLISLFWLLIGPQSSITNGNCVVNIFT